MATFRTAGIVYPDPDEAIQMDRSYSSNTVVLRIVKLAEHQGLNLFSKYDPFEESSLRTSQEIKYIDV
ncbi:MAG: hypothetical protein WD355_06835 [Balneolaceae bacterium]